MELREDLLSETEVRSFLAQGFLTPGRVLTDEQIERLHSEIDNVLDVEVPDGVATADMVKDRVNADSDGVPGSFPLLVGLYKSLPAFHEVAVSPLLTRWAGQLLGAPTVVLLSDQAFIKPPGAESAELHWHQDWYPYPLETPDVVTCWIALDDVTLVNGAMSMAVGTSSLGQFVPVDAITGTLAPRAAAYLENGFKVMPEIEQVGIRVQPIEIKAGECSFHHCLTWHKSGLNTTMERRRAIAERYVDGRAIWTGSVEGAYSVNSYPTSPELVGRPIAENHFLTAISCT